MDIINMAKNLLKKVDFDRLKDFDKDNDILLIKFSLNSNSEDYISIENLGKFVKFLHEQGYKTIVMPKEIDITIENKDTVRKFIELVEKNFNKI